MQLLAGSRIIEVDQCAWQLENESLSRDARSLKEDRELFFAAQKLFGLLITLGEAFAYVVSGMYGDPRALGIGMSSLIIAQLFFAGVIAILRGAEHFGHHAKVRRAAPEGLEESLNGVC